MWVAAGARTLVTACLLAAAPAAHAQLVRSAAPPGFEDLDAPQPAVVDIWFDGTRIGMSEALVRPGFIRFDDPQAVADLLPEAIDRRAVAAALAGELTAHANRICGSVPDPGCGVLEPAIAAVIFDLARFRADVFVATAYRGVGPDPNLFLSPPGWRPSAVQGFDVAASLASDDEGRAVLSGRSLIAAGPTRLIGDYGVDVDAGLFTDTLAAQYDRKSWRLEGGLDRAAPVPALGERRFVGARLATTLDTRLSRFTVRGSPLFVTLARRSQVEVFRDDRLLTVQSLPAGTQQIDTTALPNGSYDVTLRILSSAGVREEQRFFVKSDALPPRGAPQGLFEAGFLADEEQAAFPELGREPFVHWAFRYRLSDGFGVGADLAATRRETAGSLRALALFQDVEVAADAFVTDDGTYGATLSGRGALGRLDYAFNLRRIEGDRGAGVIDEGDLDDGSDDRFVADDALDRLAADLDVSSEAELSLAYRFDFGPRIGLRAFYRQNDVADDSYAVGPNLFWPLGTVYGARVDLFAEGGVTDRESFALARVRIGFDSLFGRAEATSGYRYSDNGDNSAGAAAGLALTHDWDFAGSGRLAATGRAERDASGTILGGAVIAESTLGAIEMSADHDLDRGDSRLALTGRTTTVAGVGGAGLAAAAQDSALVIVVEGQADARFEVLVDERTRGEVRVGRKLVVPLRPYGAYRVRLRQRDGDLVAYDGGVREHTLYPGTVAVERWSIDPLVSVFGRIVTTNGDALANATLMTEPPVPTDAGGYFQVELPAGRSAIDVRTRGRTCRLALPRITPTDDYLRLGDIACVPTLD